jgi:predicted transcriptional regulator
MPKKSAAVTATELEVLKALWKQGSATVRDLEAHFGKRKGWAYTTIQTLLYRLQEKGFVKTDKRTMPHVFQAKVSRTELLRLRLRDLADTLCEGTATPLLMTLVEDQPLEEDAIQELRQLLDRLEDERKNAREEES